MVDDRKSTNLGGAVVIVLALCVFAPWLFPAAGPRIVGAEQRMWLEAFGIDAVVWMEGSGWRLYQSLFRETDIEDAVYHFFVLRSTESPDHLSRALNWYGQFAEKALQNWFATIHRICVRLYMVGLWLPLLPFIVCPALLHGMMAWRCMLYSFAYPSPTVHAWAGHALLWCGLLSPLLLILPVPLPPLVFPMLFGGIAFAVHQLAQHSPKAL